jgi:integrase
MSKNSTLTGSPFPYRTETRRPLGGHPPARLGEPALGHSSIAITDGVYGHFERAQQKRQIEALAAAFTV